MKKNINNYTYSSFTNIANVFGSFDTALVNKSEQPEGPWAQYNLYNQFNNDIFCISRCLT